MSSGPELGAYYHEFFLRDKPHLAAQMFCKNARAKLAMANDSLSQPKPPQAPPQPPQPQPQHIPSGVVQNTPPPTQLRQQVSQQSVKSTDSVPSALLLALHQQQQNKTIDTNIKSLLSPQLSNVQLLERQMQLLQQEQAQRLLVERLLQQQQQPTIQEQQQQARLLQMRQLMEIRMQQRQGRVPHGSRAHAA